VLTAYIFSLVVSHCRSPRSTLHGRPTTVGRIGLFSKGNEQGCLSLADLGFLLIDFCKNWMCLERRMRRRTMDLAQRPKLQWATTCSMAKGQKKIVERPVVVFGQRMITASARPFLQLSDKVTSTLLLYL
jgi:hypothetical protein